MATLGDIATTARFLTQTDTVFYPDSQLLINLNTWYQKIVSMILESQDETDFDDARKTDYPIKTTPLVVGQRDYPIPVSENVLKIKRVDISYDGGLNYYRATPIDSGEWMWDDGAVATNTDSNFIKTAPRYDPKYNSIFIYPAPVTGDSGSIRIEWERNVTPFTTSDYTSVLTDSTVIPGFDAPFHQMLADGSAFEYAEARQLPIAAQLAQKLQDWEIRLRQHYSHKELDRDLTFTSAYDDWYGR